MRNFVFLLILICTVLFSRQIMTGKQPVQITTITPDTVTDLQMLERYGQGGMNEVLAFSPVDERIAVGSSRGIYMVDNLDAEAGLIELFREDGSPFNVTSLLFSPDGNLIFAGSDEETITGSNDERVLDDHEEIIAYDLVQGRVVYRITGNTPHAISNDASMLAYETERDIKVADIATGNLLYDLSYDAIWNRKTSTSFFTRSVENVHFNMDDTQIFVDWSQLSGISWGEEDQEIDLWQLNDEPSYISLADAREFVPGLWYADYRATPDGMEYIIVDGRLITPDAQFTLRSQNTYTYPYDITTTPDMLTVAVPYQYKDDDTNDLYIGIYDVMSGTLQSEVITAAARSYQALRLNTDASLLAVGLDVYDVVTGELLRTFAINEYKLINSPYERILNYDEDGNVRLLDAVTMSELSIVGQNNQITSHPGIDYGDPGILWFQVIGDDGMRGQKRVSLETGTILGDFMSETVDYFRRMVSPNGAYIVFDDSQPQTIGELWYLESASRVDLPADTQPIEPYFTADNLLLLYHNQLSEIWLYDLEAGLPVITIPVDSTDSDLFFHFDFSTDGQRMLLVNYSHEQGRYLASVYDIDNDSLITVYEAETQLLESDMSEDGKLLAVISDENTSEVSIIDIENDEIIIQEPLVYLLWSLSLRNTTLVAEFVWDGRVTYNWESGELVIQAPSPSEQKPFIRTDTMLFYKDDGRVLRITTTDSMTLHEIDMGRSFYPIVISDDGQRLWIGFSDGTVELWGIQR